MKVCAGIILYVMLCCMAFADPTVWLVHPDSALNSIQTALDSCADNDIVLVCPGTYVENIMWPDVDGVHLISEMGPEETIIDGDSTNCVIILYQGEDSTTVINGFTLRNGYTHGQGGGIRCMSASSPIIMNNIICDNYAYMQGGGIDISASASPHIINNTITRNTVTGNNRYGGGIFAAYVDVYIVGNTITDNHAPYTAGGIGCWHCSGIIKDNEISNNSAGLEAGGIITQECSQLTIRDNMISDNSSNQAGGVMCYIDSSEYINNTITRNSGSLQGAGIHVCTNSYIVIDSCDISYNNGTGIYTHAWAEADIQRCTVTGNTANGIQVLQCSTTTVQHCEITDNGAAGVYCANAGRPTINYCDITGNGFYAVANYDANYTINAEYNWWGDSTGPYHDSLNPGGMGDSVSDYVDFDPWLTTPGVQEIVSGFQSMIHLNAYPNPFHDVVTITYNTPQHNAIIELAVYDVNGRLVRDFSSSEQKNTLSWNGQDNKGIKVPNGVYFVKLHAGNVVETQKLLLIR